MANMNINTTGVITMGAFKEAINSAVESYVKNAVTEMSERLGGYKRLDIGNGQSKIADGTRTVSFTIGKAYYDISKTAMYGILRLSNTLSDAQTASGSSKQDFDIYSQTVSLLKTANGKIILYKDGKDTNTIGVRLAEIHNSSSSSNVYAFINADTISISQNFDSNKGYGDVILNISLNVSSDTSNYFKKLSFDTDYYIW